MILTRRVLFPILLALLPAFSSAGELAFSGALGNSADHADLYVGKPAAGMGPVMDDTGTMWERGGSTRLNRYALDGRLLANYEIEESLDSKDQMTRVGNRLLLKIGRSVYSLALDAPTGTKPELLKVEAEVMSSSSFRDRVVIFEKSSSQLLWFHPNTGMSAPIIKTEEVPSALFLGGLRYFVWKRE